MCFVQHVELKSVFTFQPMKRLFSTIVNSAKPAATFLKLFLRTKNRQLCCLGVMEHIDLQERRAATMKRRTISFFEEVPLPTKINRTKKGRIESKYGNSVSVSYWLMIWATNSFFKSFYSISIYCQQAKFNHLTVILQKNIMIVSVSKDDGIQSTL